MQKIIHCTYCSAEIVFPEDTQVLRCSWCGRLMELPDSHVDEDDVLKALEQAQQTSSQAAQGVEQLTQQLRQIEAQKALAKQEKLLALYQEAAEYQRAGRFSAAEKSYHSILAEAPGSAEAYWQLFLCRYGVEYVCEQSTGEYIPTICHLREESVLEDADYRAALKNAHNDEMRTYYQKEAERIHGILSRYVQIRNKKRYDVFISVRQGDTLGNATKDSQIAQDIYYLLTNSCGLKVFNSRISLQAHAGEEWEPHIMSALMSAKVMLVVGTRADNMTSPWVRNEWRRFKWLMANRSEKRKMIPCLSGMSASELPAEMGYLQAVDLSALDGKDALLRAVTGMFDVQIQQEDKKSVSDAMGLLSAKKWKEANAILDSLLQKDEPAAASSGAYYAKLLCERQAGSLAGLRAQAIPLENSPFYARALENADEVLRRQLHECNLEIIQRGIAGDVWKKIREETNELQNIGKGASLAPLFREAYEENGALLEAYKDAFNDYMDRCREVEMQPVRTELKNMRDKVLQLEKTCMENRKSMNEKDGKADKLHSQSITEKKVRSPLGVLLLFLMIWLGGGMILIAAATGVVGCAFVGVVVVLITLIAFIATRKVRAAQRERVRQKRQLAMSTKGMKAKELKSKTEALAAEIASMEKSIENYKINIEKMEKEEKRILERYPHF